MPGPFMMISMVFASMQIPHTPRHDRSDDERKSEQNISDESESSCSTSSNEETPRVLTEVRCSRKRVRRVHSAPTPRKGKIDINSVFEIGSPSDGPDDDPSEVEVSSGSSASDSSRTSHDASYTNSNQSSASSKSWGGLWKWVMGKSNKEKESNDRQKELEEEVMKWRSQALILRKQNEIVHEYLKKSTVTESGADCSILLNPVGSGAFGTVWRAYNLKGNTEVAIKVSLGGKTARREIQALEELHGIEGVVKCSGHWTVEVPTHCAPDTKYRATSTTKKVVQMISMELAEGTLKDEIRRERKKKQAEAANEADGHTPAPLRGLVSIDDVTGIAVQLFGALSNMHSMGWAHYDIKPDNSLFHRMGRKLRISLADFGLARKTVGKLETNYYAVTRPYRCPELLRKEPNHPSIIDGQIRGGGAAVDCWAAACTIAELALGTHLFRFSDGGLASSSEEQLELIDQCLGCDQFFTKLKEVLGPQLGVVVLGCLNEDPFARMTASEALAILSPVAQEHPESEVALVAK